MTGTAQWWASDPIASPVEHPRGAHRSRPWRWLLLVAVIVALVAVVATTTVLARHHHSRTLGNPKVVALPAAPKSTQAVVQFFLGHGRPVLRFANNTATFPSVRPGDHCASLASRLEAFGTPRGLASIAVEAPDPALREALTNHIGAVARAIAACGSGSDYGHAAVRATFTGTVLHRILVQDGVR